MGVECILFSKPSMVLVFLSNSVTSSLIFCISERVKLSSYRFVRLTAIYFSELDVLLEESSDVFQVT